MENGGVLHEIVGVGHTLGLAERLVILGARGPEILFNPVPAGPLLIGLEIGLPKVELWIEIAEGLRPRFDPLPGHSRDRAEDPGLIILACRVSLSRRLLRPPRRMKSWWWTVARGDDALLLGRYLVCKSDVTPRR